MNFNFDFVFSGLTQDSDCTPCSGGYYCPMVGMVTPVDQCLASYYCKQYANISTPNQGKSRFLYYFNYSYFGPFHSTFFNYL